MLRTLVAALVVEVVLVVLLFCAKIPGPALLKWYRQLGTSAWVMDVLSAYVCVHTARLLVPCGSVPLAALGIQLTHDILFGWVVQRVPRGRMRVIDLFKDYARLAILAYDAIIILGTVEADALLQRVPSSLHALIGAISAYVSLLFVHSF